MGILENRIESISKIENGFETKLPPFVKKWVCENFLKLTGEGLNNTKRICVRRSGYNRAIAWLIANGIVKTKSIYPVNGYGESFEFTKPLFEGRPEIDFKKIFEKLNDDLKSMHGN